jgi:hypothetical protein
VISLVGTQLQHSLFNPNQLHHYGCEVQDNPFSGKVMSIITISPDGKVVIPLTSEGMTIFVNTWTPTQNNLQLYPHVIMSSPHPWEVVQISFPNLHIA